MNGTFIAVFVSTHETLRAEKTFKEAGIKVRTTVKPRSIGSNCQLALVFQNDARYLVLQVTRGEGFDLVGFFRREDDGAWTPLKTDDG